MNTRLLGILGIAGSVIAVVASLAFQADFSTPTSPIEWAGGFLFDMGTLAILVGLIQSKAIGRNPVARALAFLPIIAVGLHLAAVVAELAGVGSADNILYTIAIVGFVSGLVVVSVLTIAAKAWPGWRRFVPLLAVVMLLISQNIENLYLGQVVWAAPWALLGYVVTTAEDALSLVQSAAA